MLDPQRPEDRDNFFKRVKRDWKCLRPHREHRTRMIREMVGSYYSNNGAKKKVIQNLMFMAAEAMMQLAASRPQVQITTEFPEHESFAKRFEQRTNNILKEVRIERQLEPWLLDAWFSLGIMKTWSVPIGDVEFHGVFVDPGRPYAKCISLDNAVFDMRAAERSEMRYAADMFERPLEEVLEDKDYDKDARKALRGHWARLYEMEGETPAKNISLTTDYSPPDEIEDMVRLIEVHHIREDTVATYPVLGDFDNIPPLNVKPYDGLEEGRYHYLTFLDVPDNVMPASPAQQLLATHDLYNSLLRKLEQQARNQKDVPIFSAQAVTDAGRLQRASDGQWTQVNDVTGVDVKKMGGIDQLTEHFAIFIKGLADESGGNISAQLGLGPSAGTLGQDELIHGATSEAKARMKRRYLSAFSAVARSLGWMAWVDEVRYGHVQRRIDGLDFPVVSQWTPEDREGDFIEYEFLIDPNSVEYRSPEEYGNTLLSIIERAVLPLQQMIEQQGGMLDVQEYLLRIGKQFNFPWLPQIVRFDTPPVFQRPGPATQQPRMSPRTSREYVRRNVPTGGTVQSQRTQLMQSLTNGATNQQESA